MTARKKPIQKDDETSPQPQFSKKDLINSVIKKKQKRGSFFGSNIQNQINLGVQQNQKKFQYKINYNKQIRLLMIQKKIFTQKKKEFNYQNISH